MTFLLCVISVIHPLIQLLGPDSLEIALCSFSISGITWISLLSLVFSVLLISVDVGPYIKHRLTDDILYRLIFNNRPTDDLLQPCGKRLLVEISSQMFLSAKLIGHVLVVYILPLGYCSVPHF
jgi:hypothetical protein